MSGWGIPDPMVKLGKSYLRKSQIESMVIDEAAPYKSGKPRWKVTITMVSGAEHSGFLADTTAFITEVTA